MIYLDDKVFELSSKMYSEMMEMFSQMMEQFNETICKLDRMADKSDIVRMENQLSPKVNGLLDEYKQQTDILERIEKEVSK